MTTWIKNKLTTIIIAAVAVLTVAGAGAVMAAQNHNNSPRTSEGATQPGQRFEATGVIQQVSFDQGTTQSGSLAFLPNGKQATVTVTFTTATEIHTSTSSSNSGQSADASQQATLQAGMTVKVQGTAQADGSVLAREINANAEDEDDNDDNNDQGYQRLVGVIQSVDTDAQTFVLLPDGKTDAVIIAFDAQTNIEDEPDDENNGVTLAPGAHVSVEVVTRADGSLYATEIGPVNDNQDDGDNHGGDDGGDDHGGNSGSGGGDDGGSGSGSGH